MGNLPNSRTITLNPSDPFPSALGNELQDAVKAGSFGAVNMGFPSVIGTGTFIQHGTTHGTLVTRLDTSGVYNVPLGGLRQGDVITAMTVDVFGTGVASTTATLRRYSRANPLGASVVVLTITTPPVAWTGLPVTVSAGGYMIAADEVLAVEFGAASNTGLDIGNILIAAYRPI